MRYVHQGVKTRPDEPSVLANLGGASMEIEGRDEDGHAYWTCGCGTKVVAYQWYSVSCPQCGAQYNGSGQRLRDDWRSNPSVYDENVGDMEGFEAQHAADMD